MLEIWKAGKPEASEGCENWGTRRGNWMEEGREGRRNGRRKLLREGGCDREARERGPAPDASPRSPRFGLRRRGWAAGSREALPAEPQPARLLTYAAPARTAPAPKSFGRLLPRGSSFQIFPALGMFSNLLYFLLCLSLSVF
ncbi:hypothetical protein CALCODRAFT_217235 [Calocera cornea HHB12733]|uniref:Uncharacterized protein n=1 Tax=Calocera cornea HHB12733 TaxID=1353952 RepID=A0A165H7D8_9BASI|nr:hypothetical protein CALCODRAFT_217235 [Calocera cornea HHB12733]